MQSRCASTTTAPLQQFGSYVTRNHTVILHLGLARCLPNVPASCSPRFDRTISTTSEQGFGAPVAEGHMTESVVSTCEAAGIDLAAPPVAPPAPRRTLVLSGGGGRGAGQVGVYEPGPLREILLEHIDPSRVATSPVQLRVGYVDLVTGRYRTAGNDDPALRDAVLASCSLPVAFPPVALRNGRELGVDGGVRS